MTDRKLEDLKDWELEELLAIRLFGCEVTDTPTLTCTIHPLGFHNHTADWNGAGRVLNKVKSLPQFGENGSILIEWMGPEWMCSIVMEDGSNGLASNLKVEHAVALAALRALGQEAEA